MKTPIAVLISDIHYTVQNLELCSNAVQQAIDKASALYVDLIIAGDLNDSKAIIRGEVANELIRLFADRESNWRTHCNVHLIPGNHDLLSVKDNSHSLNFLAPYVSLSDRVQKTASGLYLVPYQVSNEAFLDAIKHIPKGSTIVAHQGFKGANLGSYFKDDTSVNPEAVKYLRVVSGHYHMHQNIGTVTYIGSPFTQTFAEANDGPKGFCVLYSDGSVEQIPTDLRKHIIVERTMKDLYEPVTDYVYGDIVQIKVTALYSELDKIDKKHLGMKLLRTQDFRLDKVHIDPPARVYKNAQTTVPALLDEIIDNIQESDTIKAELKQLWRKLT